MTGKPGPRDPLGTSLKPHNDPLGLMLSGWADAVFKPASLGALHALAKPRIGGPLLLTPAMVLGLGELGSALALTGMVAAPTLWAIAHPASFHAKVSPALRGYWRRSRIYEREWEKTATLSGLMKRSGTEALVPKILRVRMTPYFDQVTIRLVEGQTLAVAQSAADALAASVDVPYVRVHRIPARKVGRPMKVRLDYARLDALAETIAPAPIPEVVDLEAVPVGLTEYGETWCMELLDTHWLIGGATGSGKASVLWSLLRGIATAVRDGRVELWGIDPKSAVELKWGEAMFTRFAPPTADLPDMARMLQELVAVMEQRTQSMSGLARKHEATIDSPLIVMVIDELADLTTCSPTSLKNQINGDIAKLLRKGRAAGICLVMALQDVKKDSIPFRGLIPRAVGLRLKDTWETDAICGPGAYAAGARCSDIPGKPTATNPVDGRGVAYVTELGETLPVRVRASFVRDEDIVALARDFPAYDRENAPRPASSVLGDPEIEALEQAFAADNGQEDE